VHRATFQTISQLLLVEVNVFIRQALGLHLINGKIDIIEIKWVSVSEEHVVGRFEIIS
jgi:hypothetical protein